MKLFKLTLCLLLVITMLFGAVGCASTGRNETSVVGAKTVSLNRGEFAYFLANTVDKATEALSVTQLKEMGLDPSKPLKNQSYDASSTWLDVFISGTLKYVKELILLCEKANAEGVRLTADDGAEEKIREFRAACEKKYGVSFEAYLSVSFNGYTTVDDYRRAVEMEILAQKYLRSVRDRIYSNIGDDRISLYLAEKGIEADPTPTRNLMAMYFANDGQKRADAVMDELLDLNTDNFARLAVLRSDSQEYLYENCGEGDMSPEIDAWLYADGRRIGDIGTVDAGEGTFLLYYFSDGRSVSDWEAILAIGESDYRIWLAQAEKECPITVRQDILNLLDF